MTYDPTDGIRLSVDESRVVTLRPGSEPEQRSITTALRTYAEGYSESSSTRCYWGTTESGSEWTIAVELRWW